MLPSAAKELEGTVSYLNAFGPEAAKAFLKSWERLLDELKDGAVAHGLSRFPTLARLGYRTALVGNYVVLYYIEKNDRVIAHVFHQSQDYASIVLHGE